MLELPDISTKLKVDLSQLNAGFESAKSQAKGMAAQISEGVPDIGQKIAAKIPSPAFAVAGDEAGAGFMKGLNESVGKRSDFGKITRALAGGGIIGGLGLAATQLDELAKHVEKFALEMDKGPEALKRATAEMLVEIPIVGKLGDAGYRLYEVFSGEAQAVAQVNDALAAQELHLKNVSMAMEETTRWNKQIDEQMKDVANAIAALRLDGVPLKLFEIDTDINAKIAAIRDALPGVHAESSKTFTTEIQANNQKLAQLYDQLAKQKEVLAHRGVDVSQGIPNVPTDRGWSGAETGLSRQLSEAKQTRDQIAMYNEKNRKLRDQINNDETTAAAKAEADIAALTREGAERRAKAMRDGFLGPALRDWDTFTGHIANAWAQTGKDLQAQNDAITRPFEELQDKISKIGKSEGEQAILDFMKTGPDAGNLAAFSAMAHHLDEVKKGFQLKPEVDAFKESLESPLEKFDKLLGKLYEWKDAGLLSMAELSKGINAATDDLAKGLGGQIGQSSHLAPAIKAGSADAVRAQFLGGVDDQARAALKEQLAEAKTHRDLLQKIADNTGNFEAASF